MYDIIDPIQDSANTMAFNVNQQGQNESLRKRYEEFNRLISEGKIKPPGWLPHANLWEGDFATNVEENMRYLASIGWKQPGKGEGFFDKVKDNFGGIGGLIGGVLSGGGSLLADKGIGAIGNAIGMSDRSIGWLQDAVGQFVPGSGLEIGQVLNAADTLQESGDVWKSIDRLVDPAGTIDFSTRLNGDIVNKYTPEVTPYLSEIATTAGGTVGSLVPGIGTAIGASVGAGIGGKMKGGTRNENYLGDFINSGVAYGGGELTSGISPFVSSLVGPIVGTTAGNIIGGVAGGAARGGFSGLKPALETGSLTPIGTSALIGGLMGGATSGASEIYNAFNADSIQAAIDAEKYAKLVGSPFLESASGVDIPTLGESYEQGLQGLSSYTPDSLLPQFSVNPELAYASWLKPLADYTMKPNADMILPQSSETPVIMPKGIPNLPQLNVQFGKDWYKPSFANDYEKMITERYAPFKVNPELQYGGTQLNPITDYQMGGGSTAAQPTYNTGSVTGNTPSGTNGVWDQVQDIAGKVGKAVLDNVGSLKSLASLLSSAGQSTILYSNDEGRLPGVTPDGFTETLMTHSQGSRNSKALKPGMVEGPGFNAMSFIPNNSGIKKYDKSGLYYS